MHVFRNTEEIRKFIGDKKTAVALGAFDGLHIGHYKVIRTAVESGLTPVVFTFRDNPAEYLTGTCCYLTTVEERMRILEGPVCANKWVWWKVRSLKSGLEGWTSEGDKDKYWLVPATPQAP